jgi:hypothetical protein
MNTITPKLTIKKFDIFFSFVLLKSSIFGAIEKEKIPSLRSNFPEAIFSWSVSIKTCPKPKKLR